MPCKTISIKQVGITKEYSGIGPFSTKEVLTSKPLIICKLSQQCQIALRIGSFAQTKKGGLGNLLDLSSMILLSRASAN